MQIMVYVRTGTHTPISLTIDCLLFPYYNKTTFAPAFYTLLNKVVLSNSHFTISVFAAVHFFFIICRKNLNIDRVDTLNFS